MKRKAKELEMMAKSKNQQDKLQNKGGGGIFGSPLATFATSLISNFTGKNDIILIN